MTKSHSEVLKILKEKGFNLNEEDIETIRSEYPFFSSEELEDIGYIEEIIAQIEITPKEDVKI